MTESEQLFWVRARELDQRINDRFPVGSDDLPPEICQLVNLVRLHLCLEHEHDPVAAHDPVAHPSHYTSHPSGIECVMITQHHNFCVGNAIKYLWRQGLKEGNPSIQDLKKARQYIDFEIARLEASEPKR